MDYCIYCFQISGALVPYDTFLADGTAVCKSHVTGLAFKGGTMTPPSEVILQYSREVKA